MAPHSDSGEEVALSKSSKLIWCDVTDVPFIDDARRDVAGGNQVAQPLGRIWVTLVVEGAHASIAFNSRLTMIPKAVRPVLP